MTWYETLGFSDNPLSIKRKDFLVGAGILKLKEKILKHIHAEENVLVYGIPGVGKTTLARSLEKEVKSYKPIYLYCKKFTNILFDLEAELKKTRTFSDLFRKKEKVLLLDEFNKLHPDMVDQIMSYYDDSDVRSIILFQVDENIKNSSLPNLKRIFSKNKYEVPILEFEELKNLMAERLGGKKVIDDDALKLIYGKEAKVTRDILFACSGICQAYLTKRNQKISVKDVQEYYKNKPSFDDDVLDEEETSEPLQETKQNPTNLNAKSTSKLSPLQKKIIKILIVGDSSAPVMAKELGKGIGSIGKQLSLLWESGIVDKDDAGRPVKYALKKEHKDLYMTD